MTIKKRYIESLIDDLSPQPKHMNIISNNLSSGVWSANGDRFWPVSESHKQLPAGLYVTKYSDTIGPFLERTSTETDNLFVLPDSINEEVINEIKIFRELREEFKKNGYLHKRGILLWGPPGSGKTSTVHQLIDLVVNHHDGIAIIINNPHTAVDCLQMVRKLEKTRPIIAIMEDLEALIEEWGEPQYLSLLDGETQIDDIVFVATTNYPETLDPRFIDRPSRFDTIREIGMPSVAARKYYLTKKGISMSKEDIDYFVSNSQGFSIAHLRELVILFCLFHKTKEETIKRLQAFKVEKNSKNSGKASSIGFGFNVRN